MSLGKALNAVSHLGAKQSIRCGGPAWRKTCTVVVAQPDERHVNRTASVLEWYDRHRASTSGLNEEEEDIDLCGHKAHIFRMTLMIHSYVDLSLGMFSNKTVIC